MIAFSIQIYGDFSGYTDVARGSARLLGIELSRNFKQPYLSSSITDFWRRWHISLSDWLRDYLYIPLGRQPWQHVHDVPEPPPHDVAWGSLARGWLELSDLGRAARGRPRSAPGPGAPAGPEPQQNLRRHSASWPPSYL